MVPLWKLCPVCLCVRVPEGKGAWCVWRPKDLATVVVVVWRPKDSVAAVVGVVVVVMVVVVVLVC